MSFYHFLKMHYYYSRRTNRLEFIFTINDEFWSHFQKLIREVVIPYQKRILSDELANIEKSHAIENFRIAAGASEGEFYGMVFQDSDVAKWIEAASYSLMLAQDEQLEKELDDLIEIIGKAQQPDGYLDTYFIIKEPEHRWQNLREAHELYCAGHMMEAAVAHARATGKNTLLRIMEKNADHIADRFGIGRVRGYPGHPEIELALVKLYEATGNKKYLNLASYFIDERGTDPDFFTEESGRIDWVVWGKYARNPEYNQAHKPVREQSEAAGHAVRAVYLYTGMADVAEKTGDESLTKACDRLWNNIVEKQMYVTGGIGSTCNGEAFTKDYDLPNDTAYAETCASIGLIFFAKRMLELHPKAEYADVMERALYNCVLSGMSCDGKRFFYVNPLDVNPEYSGKIAGHAHVLPERPTWYGCACCPPNLARLVASLGDYAWLKKDDTYYSNLFIGGTFHDTKDGGCDIELRTAYPAGGALSYVIHTDRMRCLRIAVRIPEWADCYTVSVKGEIYKPIVQNGYAVIEGVFSEGDTIEVRFSMEAKKIYANARVREDAGCVAFQCGPFIYCIEGIDNQGDLQTLRVKSEGKMAKSMIKDPVLGEIPVLEIEGARLENQDRLYGYRKPSAQSVTLIAIPYYLWGNRGKNQMKVWIPEIA